ncbi:dihydrofolate reductase [Rhizobium brockwellii]|uniref:dihydrofolate reductase n=1 Tax=Rhizobium brockwellii TaxID=3019932 RepID=UPI003F972B70
MPSAVSVVARSIPDHIIGIENKLPWHLGTDLKHFKQLTQGHVIIMGRKTFESLGRPLPNRVNIVLSREVIEDKSNVVWAKNPETALFLADFHSIRRDKKQFFVIGGENIYILFQDYINKIFLTEVDSGPINGDAKFDFNFDPTEWYYKFRRKFDKSNVDDFPFTISYILRRVQAHRERMIEDFKDRNRLFDQNWERFSTEAVVNNDEAWIEQTQLDFLERL